MNTIFLSVIRQWCLFNGNDFLILPVDVNIRRFEYRSRFIKMAMLHCRE